MAEETDQLKTRSSMAKDYTAFPTSQPLFNPVPVNDNSKGSEALAEVFGDVSKVAVAEGQTIEEQHSTDSLLSANSMLNQVSTQARIQMMQDSTPRNVNSVINNWQTTADSIKQNTALNHDDRNKLNELVDSNRNQLDLHGTTLSMDNVKATKKRIFYDNLSSSTDTLKDLMKQGKYEEAQNIGESMYQSARDVHDANVISGQEMMSLQRGFGVVMNQAKRLHSVIENGEDVTAKDYHDLHAWPFGGGGDASKNAAMPSDENTNHLYLMHLNDQSYSSQLAAAVKNGGLDPEALAALPDHQQISIATIARGAREAENYLTSNSSWTSFVAKYDQLKSQPEDSLNAYEKGMKDHMEYTIKNLQSGNYDQVMADTVKGAQIEQRFQIQYSSINDSNTATPEQKESLNIKNLNDYISQKVALGSSMHLPNPWIQPINYQYKKPVEDSFVAGADPTNAIKGMTTLYPQNKIYLVNAMATPRQQESMRIIAQTTQNTPVPFMKDIIIANQTNANFSQLQVDGASNTKLRTQVQASIANILDYSYRNGNATSLLGQSVGTQGGQQNVQSGLQRNSALVDVAMNYVKLQAINHGDYAMNNADTYIQDFKNNINTTYNIMSGYNYSFNNVNLGATLTKNEADAVAHLAMIDATDRVKSHLGENEYMSVLDRNPLFMTIDQYNNIVVTDTKTKSIVYQIPFSKSYVDLALHQQRKDNLENEKFSEQEKFPSSIQ